jgi:MSHA biogenesis protein MshL
MKLGSIARVIALLATCAACAQSGPEAPVDEGGPAARALDEALAEAPGARADAPPPAVVDSLLPPLSVPALPDGKDEPRFDVSVERVAAREFFVGLVEDTPYNIVVHPDVKGRISLQLKNVTVREVLDVVREVYGYEYHQMPAGFQIEARGLRTRIFEVSYLDVQRDGQSHTRVSSGQVSDRASESGAGGSSGDDGASLSPTSEDRAAISGSMISTTSASDLWEDLRASLELIVGREQGRSVVTSPAAGILAVRAYPDELREVEYYLASIERSVHRQVILEAKIIEVTLDDSFRTGINWALLSLPGEDDSILTGQTGGGTLLDSTGLSEIAGNLGDLDPGTLLGLPATADTSTFGGAFTIAIESDEFAGLIEALETQGHVQVLSSPRVSTLNNQKAVIKVGTDEFFVTDISTTTVTGTSTTTNPDVELTPFFSGIALDVTPQIGSDDYVTLHIHPSISEVEDQIKVVSLGSSSSGDDEPLVNDIQLPLALSTIRESDSVVRARSRQVIVIGGLMQDNEAQRSAGTPWLGRLPLIGHLFSHRLEESFKKELVILVRPVVVDGGTWAGTIRESAERVRAMEGRPPAAPAGEPR